MKKFKLLVFIDDDHATNVFHEIIVQESNLCEQHLFFSSPIKALAYFENLKQEVNPTWPDAIFLDINMPMLDGWEFIENYRKLGIKESPVIIMLTTSLYSKDVEKADQIDIIHNFIGKPLEVEYLEALRVDLLEPIPSEQA